MQRKIVKTSLVHVGFPMLFPALNHPVPASLRAAGVDALQAVLYIAKRRGAAWLVALVRADDAMTTR
jgi:hypothetical protein